MIAEIITIGDEILIGQIVDTNSAWIARQLSGIGISVKQISSVSDSREHILKALEEAESRADLILITGGLGPTKDDITKHTLCEYFNTSLRFDDEVYKHVEALFKRFGLKVTKVNRKQAEVPESCTLIHNAYGTAPGMWFSPPLTPPIGGRTGIEKGDYYKTADPGLYEKLEAKALEMRNNPTEAESILWNFLRNKQIGYKFRRQHIIDRFIVDLVCLDKMLVIEVDGDIHDDQKEEDELRTSVLNDRGFKVIRFQNREIIVDPDGVVNRIKKTLGKTVSPQGGDGRGAVFVSMPGVPYEMKAMMENEILQKIKNHFKTPAIVHRTVLTQGIGESFLSDKLNDWENSLKKVSIKLAYLPSPGMVRLRLSTLGNDEKSLLKIVDKKIEELKSIIPKYIFGYEEDKLEEIIGKLLIENKKTLSTAESCTGGYIAHRITSVPGSSAYYKGSVVSYSNEIKIASLGVNEKTLSKHGAVSEQVVKEMAEGAQKKFKTDFAIACTGIAGPEGGTAEKPVGTVWIAIATPDSGYSRNSERSRTIKTEKFLFGDNRMRNIHITAITALNMLRKEIKSP